MEEETQQPKKGILRNKSEDKHHSGIHWDEMNILMTHHPPDKDYGHIKINEPPTPYSKWKDPDDEEGEGAVEPFSDEEADPEKLDPENLHDRIKDAPKRRSWEEGAGNDDEDPDDELSESQKGLNKEFKDKRKKHYNEYSQVKLARKLIEQELKDLEDGNDSAASDSTKDGASSSETSADTQMDET